MTISNEEIKNTEIAWLRLMHTRGIGSKRAWGIYRQLSSSNLGIAEVFSQANGELRKIPGISPALSSKLEATDISHVEDRYNFLQQSAIRLLYPGSTEFKVPDIPGLPPTLTLWGDLPLLNVPSAAVLLKSRDTNDSILTNFLQALTLGKVTTKNWFFCPFSRLDWELVESLLKLNCGIILGLVSGISKRVMTLKREVPGGRLVALAPEPPLRSRRALFACIEAFYRFFSEISQQVFLLHKRDSGKTAQRLRWAVQAGHAVEVFDPILSQSQKTKKSEPHEKNSGDKTNGPSYPPDDDEFITCL